MRAPSLTFIERLWRASVCARLARHIWRQFFRAWHSVDNDPGIVSQILLCKSPDRFQCDCSVGANVLDSPALALGHLARLLAGQPETPPLAAGEIVTTGTITDAWPVSPGEIWSSDYGALGLSGLTLRFTAP